MTLEDSRSSLQGTFEAICDHVYFQPPASVKMTYPAIVYNLSDIDKRNANNTGYKIDHAYMVTLISRDPVDERVDSLEALPLCSFNRYYSADNLHHWVFTIYHK